MNSLRLIPDPCRSDIETRRFFHQDLEEITPKQLWAERDVIESELASRITYDVRPRVIWAAGDLVYDSDWLEERARRLRAEERRRKRSQHAA